MKKKHYPYPSWAAPLSDGSVSSLQQMDGTPDFQVYSRGGRWYCKWRTSAMTDGPYASAAAAIEDVEAQFRKTA